MKKVNLVVYLPGHGGHFIQNMLSLTERSVPIALGKDFSLLFSKTLNLEERATYYSFKDLRKKYSSWADFHSEAISPYDLYKLLTDLDYDVCTIAIHPDMLYSIIDALKGVEIRYVAVRLHNDFLPMIEEFRESNDGFPFTSDANDDMLEHYIEEYNPYIVNFEQFLVGEHQFSHEYQRVCQALSIDNTGISFELIMQLYRDWIAERNQK